MRRPRRGGFTLLETMIAVAIVAVLAAFALPAYRAQVARAHRVDAAAAVYRAAQFVEAAWLESAVALPPGLDRAPSSGAAVYRLRALIADDTNGGYAIEATPVESGPMRDDACGVFVLDATGQRTNRRANDDAPALAGEDCWSGK